MKIFILIAFCFQIVTQGTANETTHNLTIFHANMLYHAIKEEYVASLREKEPDYISPISSKNKISNTITSLIRDQLTLQHHSNDTYIFQLEELYDKERFDQISKSLLSLQTQYNSLKNDQFDISILKDSNLYSSFSYDLRKFIRSISSLITSYFSIETFLLQSFDSSSLNIKSLIKDFTNSDLQFISELGEYLKAKFQSNLLTKEEKIYKLNKIKVQNYFKTLKALLQKRKIKVLNFFNLLNAKLKEESFKEKENEPQKKHLDNLKRYLEVHETLRTLLPMLDNYIKRLLVPKMKLNRFSKILRIQEIGIRAIDEFEEIRDVVNETLYNKIKDEIKETGKLKRRFIFVLKIIMDFLPVTFLEISLAIVLNNRISMVFEKYMQVIKDYLNKYY